MGAPRDRDPSVPLMFHRPCTPRRAIHGLLLAALLPLLLGAATSSDGLIEVTLNAIPAEQAELLVVPPHGFTVDVSFPDPTQVDPASLRVWAAGWSSAGFTDFADDVVQSGPWGATILVSPPNALAVGSASLYAIVQRWDGAYISARQDFAIREHVSGAPLEQGQKVFLDFAADRDGDGQPDFRYDLAEFGLAVTSGTASRQYQGALAGVWVQNQVTLKARSFYLLENPSGLPGGDALDVSFTSYRPQSGPFTRICVGGASPAGAGVIGNVPLDPVNSTLTDDACDDLLGTGVFPRELLYYSFAPTFQAVFGPMQAEPVGSHPLDSIVLSPAYDPGDPAQSARRAQIVDAINLLAQVLGTIVAHEAGHALGMTAPGIPGGGLHGGLQGPEDGHNLTPEGLVPAESFLMNEGASFSFDDLAGTGGVGPRIRELNWAYLHGRVVLNDLVTEVLPPPIVDGASPSVIPLDGPSVVTITVLGSQFVATPSVRLVGPDHHALISETLNGGVLTGSAIVPSLVAGTYDVEVTNPDGQVAVLPSAIVVTAPAE